MNIRLLQWNIWDRELPENIVEALEEIDADIMCLQELTTTASHETNFNLSQYIADNLNYHYFYKAAQVWKKPDKITTQGNGIFSKYNLSNVAHVFVQEQLKPEPDASEQGRVYVQCTATINDTAIIVGTVHLSYTHRMAMTEAKREQEDKLIDVIKAHEERYIFAGDLNSLPNSYIVENISKYIHNCGPAMQEGTWPTKPFKDGDYSIDTPNDRIDYVFATKDIKVKSAKILEIPYSDHAPILVEFSLY